MNKSKKRDPRKKRSATLTDSRDTSKNAQSAQAMIHLAREFIEQAIRRFPQSSTTEIHAAVLDSFHKLSSTELRNAISKHNALEGNFETEALERGFWAYFVEQLDFAMDTDPDDLNRKDIHFFYNTLKSWSELPTGIQKQFARAAARRTTIHPAPCLPPDLIAKLSKKFRSVEKYSSEDSIIQHIPGSINQHDIMKLSLSEMKRRSHLETQELNRLKVRFEQGAGDVPEYWLGELDRLMDSKEHPNLKVAIVGDTGAGKSSLINALLGEDLVPCNSSRACTPFPISISHRSSSDIEARILITVDFVDRESWCQPFAEFFSTLQNKVDVSEDSLAEEDENFELLREQLYQLCPDLVDKQIRPLGLEDLLQRREICDRLGQTEKHFFDRSKDAQFMVDELIYGRSASGGSISKGGLPPLWPLVKSVSIEVNNQVLEDGLVLIDLPGIHDSNKARCSVAARYLKECSAAWVIAPIVRATDNAGAKALMAKCLEQGFHLDGVSLTVICTQTDQIDTPEKEMKRLGISEQISALKTKQSKLRELISVLKATDQDLVRKQEVAKIELEVARRQSCSQYSYQAHLEEGSPPVSSSPPYVSRKRKWMTPNYAFQESHVDKSQGFNAKAARLDSQPFLAANEVNVMATSKATASDIQTKLESWNAVVQELQDNQLKLHGAISDADNIEPQMTQACVEARNKNTVKLVQESFTREWKKLFDRGQMDSLKSKSQLQEMKEELSAIVGELTVIPVSAKVYLKLLEKERASRSSKNSIDDAEHITSDCFTLEQTGIPILARHCRMQAQAKYSYHHGRRLNQVGKLKYNLARWALGADLDVHLTEEILNLESQLLKGTFSVTHQGFLTTVSRINSDVLSTIQENFLNDFPEACVKARKKAPSMTEKFSRSIPNRNTYRAVLLRHGKFTSTNKDTYDLNHTLSQPIWNHVGRGWNMASAVAIPQIAGREACSCQSRISRLKEHVVCRATSLGYPAYALRLIDEQLERHKIDIGDAFNEFHQHLQFSLRQTRSGTTEIIQQGLLAGYADTVTITGKGATSAMKDRILVHVQKASGRIFKDCSDKVAEDVNAALEVATEGLQRKLIEVIFPAVKRDCESMFKPIETRVDPEIVSLQRDVASILKEESEKVKSEGRFQSKGKVQDEGEERKEAQVKIEASEDEHDDEKTDHNDVSDQDEDDGQNDEMDWDEDSQDEEADQGDQVEDDGQIGGNEWDDWDDGYDRKEEGDIE